MRGWQPLDRSLSPRAGDSAARIHLPTSARFYGAAIEGLAVLDEEILLAAEGRIPPLYEAGVRYELEPRDTWRHVGDIYRQGWGDCEDLAAWRVAELRTSGEDPDARPFVYRTGPRRYHAVVERSGGAIEDPSLVLGMPVSAERRARMPRHVAEATMDGYDDRDESDESEEPEAPEPEESETPKRRRGPTAAQKRGAKKWGRRAFKWGRRAAKFTPQYQAAMAARSAVSGGPEPWQCAIEDDPEPGCDRVRIETTQVGEVWGATARVPLRTGRSLALRTTPSRTPKIAQKKALNLVSTAYRQPAVRQSVTADVREVLHSLSRARR